MNGFLYTLLVLLVVAIWGRIDFILGKKRNQKRVQRHEQKTRYSKLELFPLGDLFFNRLINDLRQATDHIHLQFYIFRVDHIGNEIIKLLEDKSREGVVVRVLVDRIGSTIPRKRLKKMKQAGISFSYSQVPKLPYLFYSLNHRNHRKVVVIDGKVGYIGGYNIGDEYLGRNPSFGLWRDFHLRMEGDGTQDLQDQFLTDWQTAKQTYTNKERYYPPLAKGNHPLYILPTDGLYLEETFIKLIQQAKEKILLGTPYFIPGPLLQKELILAAQKGIDVKIIIPRKADHPFVKEAAFPYFHDLLHEGVDIYQYYRGFYHVKSIVIDDHICDIGTANVDKRSFHLNNEINCLIHDPEFIQTVIKEMEHDIAISERLMLDAFMSRSFVQKGKEKVATIFSGLL